MLATATAIAIGGVLHGRRVAETMSKRITAMNSGQGCSANLVSSAVVVGASFLGMPVSTTHVSCGSLFGIGAVTRQADWRMVKTIVAAWLLTLPCGMVMGAVGYRALQLFAAR
jgi:PiT family inorganic phosphate transporter